MAKDKIEEAIKFQESELSKLSELSYEELKKLKGRVELESPESLSTFSFAREIIVDEYDGLEVSVFHYFYPDEELTKIVQSIVSTPGITMGESKMRRWFNISKKGTIEWPSFDHEDGDD